jgi:hypothetical protein
MFCPFHCQFYLYLQSASPSRPFLLPTCSTTPDQVYTRYPRPSAQAPPPSSLSSSDPYLHPNPCLLLFEMVNIFVLPKHPISQFLSTSSVSPSLPCFITHLSSISIPKTMHDALSDSGWWGNIELEVDVYQNETWELVPLLPAK